METITFPTSHNQPEKPLFEKNKINYNLEQYLTKKRIEEYLLNPTLANQVESIRTKNYPNKIEDLITLRGYLFYITNLINYYQHHSYSKFLDIYNITPYIENYQKQIEGLNVNITQNQNELTKTTLYLQTRLFQGTIQEQINILILASMLKQDLLVHLKGYYTKQDIILVEQFINSKMRENRSLVTSMLKENYSQNWKEEVKRIQLKYKNIYSITKHN